MSMTESRSVTRGTLWLIIAVCVALMGGLTTIAITGAAAWARTVEDRGVDNAKRITVLEAKISGMDAKLDAAAERQKDLLDLLREHMRKEK